jgi:hypothetical protein
LLVQIDLYDRTTPWAVDLYGRIIGWNVDLYAKSIPVMLICNAESLPGILILTPGSQIRIRQNRHWNIDLYCRITNWIVDL